MLENCPVFKIYFLKNTTCSKKNLSTFINYIIIIYLQLFGVGAVYFINYVKEVINYKTYHERGN